MADFEAKRVEDGWQYIDKATGITSGVFGNEKDAREDLIKRKQTKKAKPKTKPKAEAKPERPGFLERMTTPTKWWDPQDRPELQMAPSGLGTRAQAWGYPGTDSMNRPVDIKQRTLAEQDAAIDKAVGFTPGKVPSEDDMREMYRQRHLKNQESVQREGERIGMEEMADTELAVDQQRIARDERQAYTEERRPTDEGELAAEKERIAMGKRQTRMHADKTRKEEIDARKNKALSRIQWRGDEDSKKINETLEGLDKKTKALAKEKTGKYFIDPGSGFALNLDKMKEGNKRREVMDMAALLPAASRASFLHKAGYIEPEDMPEASALDQLKLKAVENQIANTLLKKQQLEQQGKDYMSPETKQHWETFRTSLKEGQYELVMHLGEKIGMTDLEVEKMINLDRRARVAAAKTSGMDKMWKNTFGEGFSDYRKARDTTMKRAHDRLAMRTDDAGNEGKRTAFLEQYNLLDWSKAEAMIAQKTTTEDGQASTAFNDWLRSRTAKDPALAYARQAMPEKLNKGNYNAFLAHAMSTMDLSNSYGWEGLQQRIRAEESDRQKFDEKVLNPKSGEDTGDKPPAPVNVEGKDDEKPVKMFKATGAKTASQVLVQAQEAGFPTQYTGEQFVDQLNRKQGTKYSWPDNVPAEFPKFWGNIKEENEILTENIQSKLDKKNPKYEGLMSLVNMFPQKRRDVTHSLHEVPRGNSVDKIFQYGSKAIPEKGPSGSWDEMKKGAYKLPSMPFAYDRQPPFFREKKWDNKEGMYQYFFQNPVELKQVPGEVRQQLIKEIVQYIKTVDIKEK